MAAAASWWQRFGNAAQIAQVMVAALGFSVLVLQLNEVRSNNRAASARQVYLAYMDLEFRYPQFAEPDYASIKTGDRDDKSRYESFVSYLLYACEEALVAFAGQREWVTACDDALRPHLPFLCDKSAAEPSYLATVSDDTAAFIKSAMARAGVTPPACKPKGT